MRRGDHDAIGEVILAAAIVDQDGTRDDCSWSDGAPARKALACPTRVDRYVGAVSRTVIADGLRDGENVSFVEAASERSTPVSAGSELDHLLRIAPVRAAFAILALETGRVDQHFSRRGLACERRDARAQLCVHRTGQGFTPQMPDAYSAMVRSLENLPEPATFKTALRAQARGSR